MVEMAICLLVEIATTLGAAGRAAGLLSTLPWDCRGYPRGCLGYF